MAIFRHPTPDLAMDAVFLEYYLRTQKAEMDRLAPKGTQKNINIQFLKPWLILRPSIDEQRALLEKTMQEGMAFRTRS